ncbi:OmpA family protein, partial [Bacteroides fragilis]|nr:OmpA family protein [Bacteroides fragilis]
IRRRIDTLMLDKEAAITSIIVKGFASLEGSSALNLKLSGSRAEALKRYLTSHYSIDTQLIRSESGGEDWEGL